jgi:hypothetical protein
MKKYKRYNFLFLTITVLGVSGFGCVNAAIDPYGIMNAPKIQGLNDLKPRQFANVRLFKAIDVIEQRPKTILLGSSRSDWGLDPGHPAFVAKPVYNLGLVGPNMYEVRRYFEHALANQPDLKQVVLGLDFFMFNQYKVNSVDFDEKRLGQRFIRLEDLLKTTLSTDALNASIETIEASFQSDASYLYTSSGKRFVYGGKLKESMRTRFETSIAEYLNTEGYYKRFKLSQAFLADLRTLVEVCKARNIDLKVFISPSHAMQSEALRKAGLWSEFEAWKREVVKITPVWDFSGYNSVTTEPVSDRMTNFWDSSHYRKEVGDLVLNRLFAHALEQVPDDFGVLLTTETVESGLAQTVTGRAAWVAEHSKEIAREMAGKR